MIGQKPPTGGIFLTASQSMQSLRTDMQLVQQTNREGRSPEVEGDLGGKTLQQAPSAEQQDAARADADKSA